MHPLLPNFNVCDGNGSNGDSISSCGQRLTILAHEPQLFFVEVDRESQPLESLPFKPDKKTSESLRPKTRSTVLDGVWTSDRRAQLGLTSGGL